MWILFALGASVFWGITYAINEQIYKHISVLSSIALTLGASGLLVGIIALCMGVLGKDVSVLASSPKTLWMFVIGILVLTIAELFIGYSIVAKNATIAGLIEISYPFFIVLFSYFIFKENNITLATSIGGVCIFVGVAIIYLFNK